MVPSVSHLIASSTSKADTVEYIGHALIDRADSVEYGLLPQLTLAEETVGLVWVAYGSALHRPVSEVRSDFPDASAVSAALRRIDALAAADGFERNVEGCLTSEDNGVLEALWNYIVLHQHEISLDAEPENT
jgi:hypothetical protein